MEITPSESWWRYSSTVHDLQSLFVFLIMGGKAKDEMANGWICLHRELLDKPIWKKSTPHQRLILIVVLLLANHKPNEWEWKGVKFKVKPGQFVTSLESIRKRAGEGISTQNVRSALKRFEKLQFLTNKATKSGRLISIINWGDYQTKASKPNKEGNKDPTKTQQRPNKDPTPNNNDNNVNNDKKKKNKRFIPPSEDDVIKYFTKKGYLESVGKKAFEYYNEAEPPWTDVNGKKVRGWKQKMVGVWFKDENKISKTIAKQKEITPGNVSELYDN